MHKYFMMIIFYTIKAVIDNTYCDLYPVWLYHGTVHIARAHWGEGIFQMQAHQIVFFINIDITFCAVGRGGLKKAKKCVAHFMDGFCNSPKNKDRAWIRLKYMK